MGLIRLCFVALALLFYKSNLSGRDSITVYLFLLDECRICQEVMPDINACYDMYATTFGFIGLFPNFSSKKENIHTFKKKYKAKFETKTDYYKRWAQKFNASVLPEVIVFNETKQKVEYRGAINDLFISPGKRRSSIQRHYLKEALEAISKGQQPSIQESVPIGCYINLNDKLN